MHDIDFSQFNNKDELLKYYSALQPKLCMKLNESFNNLNISGLEREKRIASINFLAIKDVKTAEHSIRVALLCEQIGNKLKIDSKELLCSGLLHDMGKILIPNEVLQKTENFSKDDMEVMKEHPLNTFRLIGETFRIEGQVGLRHHFYQIDGYPKELPVTDYIFSEIEEFKIEYYSKIISIADFFDAATSRTNYKISNCRPLSIDEATEALKFKNPDSIQLIDYLSECDVFKKHLELL